MKKKTFYIQYIRTHIAHSNNSLCFLLLLNYKYCYYFLLLFPLCIRLKCTAPNKQTDLFTNIVEHQKYFKIKLNTEHATN